MMIRAEVTIDLDEKRRVWSTAEAADVDPEDVRDAARGLTLAASAGALDSYGKVVAHRPDLGDVPPQQFDNPELPPHKRPGMPAFGDDDED